MLGSDSERHSVATVHVASWSAASASAVLMATRVRLVLAKCSAGAAGCTAPPASAQASSTAAISPLPGVAGNSGAQSNGQHRHPGHGCA